MDVGFMKRLKMVIGDESTHGFAKRVGISDSVMRKYISGEAVPGLDKVIAISRIKNVSLEWLATGYGRPTPGGIPALEERDRRAKRDGTYHDRSPEEQDALDEANMQGFVAIPVMNVAASAGGGAAALEEDRAGVVKFERMWLYTMCGVNPSDLFTMPVVGESMEPTIRAGEYLLASRSGHHTAPGDGIYIVRLEGDILVKRLQRLPGGRILVSSDNEAYKPYEVKLDDGVDMKILGKVVLVHGLRRV